MCGKRQTHGWMNLEPAVGSYIHEQNGRVGEQGKDSRRGEDAKALPALPTFNTACAPEGRHQNW
jgi:hypothetical protein